MATHNICRLSPAAARLLLAFLIHSDANYDETVIKSGIHEYQTLISARRQLFEQGFLVQDEHGYEYVSFAPEPPRETPHVDAGTVQRPTAISRAKGYFTKK